MAERDAALDMLIQIPGSRRLTVGADRGYYSRDFVSECRELDITPHVAQKKRWSAIDDGGIGGLLRTEKTENVGCHQAVASTTRPSNPFFRNLLMII